MATRTIVHVYDRHSDAVEVVSQLEAAGIPNGDISVVANQPGDRTTPHDHPDSVMHTLSSFRRRLHAGEAHRDVEMPAGMTGWLPAQQHSGENIGDTRTHVLFVELKDGPADKPDDVYLGPD